MEAHHIKHDPIHTTNGKSATSVSPCQATLPYLCDSADYTIIIANTSGMIQSANTHIRDAFGYTPEEVIGIRLVTLLPALHPQSSLLLAPTEDHPEMTHLTTAEHRSSTRFPVEIVVTSFEKNNQPLHFIMVRDLSDWHLEPIGELADNLSAREQQIIRLIAGGYTSKDIAEQLVISVKTVEKHRANIMTKMRANNVASLVRIAVREGLV